MKKLVPANFQDLIYEKSRYEKYQTAGIMRLPLRLLEGYEYYQLSECERSHFVGMLALCIRQGGNIPDDAEWIGLRIGAKSPVNVDRLVELGLLKRVDTMPGGNHDGRDRDSTVFTKPEESNVDNPLIDPCSIPSRPFARKGADPLLANASIPSRPLARNEEDVHPSSTIDVRTRKHESSKRDPQRGDSEKVSEASPVDEWLIITEWLEKPGWYSPSPPPAPPLSMTAQKALAFLGGPKKLKHALDGPESSPVDARVLRSQFLKAYEETRRTKCKS